METQKIANLLGNANNQSSEFATRKWYFINNQNNTNYGEGNEDSTTVKFETKVIKSNLCDYSDAYILVTGVMLILELHLKIVLIYEMHNFHKR